MDKKIERFVDALIKGSENENRRRSNMMAEVAQIEKEVAQKLHRLAVLAGNVKQVKDYAVRVESAARERRFVSYRDRDGKEIVH